MKIAQQRPRFSVFILLSDPETNAATKLYLSTKGYDAYLFSDQDLLIDRMGVATPHVLDFEADALMTPLSDFVEAVLKLN